MDIKGQFFCYLAAGIWFPPRHPGRDMEVRCPIASEREPLIALMPLGLLVALLPTFWATAEAAF